MDVSNLVVDEIEDLDLSVDDEEEVTELFPLTLNSDKLKPSGYTEIEQMDTQHIKLFFPFFIDLIKTEDIMKYSEYFTDDLLEEFPQLIKIEDENERITKIFNKMGEWCQDRQNCLALITIAVECIDFKENKYLTFEKVDKEAFAVYEYYILGKDNPESNLDNVDRLSGVLYLDEVINYLKLYSNNQIYIDIGTKIEKLWSKRTQLSRWKARCKLIIELAHAQTSKIHSMFWFNELLLALDRHPRTRPLGKYIAPDMIKINSKYKIYLQTLSTPSKINDELVDEKEKIVFPRPQTDYDSPPPTVDRNVVNSGYTLYGYQEELVGKAKQGLNTVICAPTGSGKTIVALDILLNHLREKRQRQKIGRVVMFVPTIPLVDQQCKRINDRIGTEFYVTKLSGAERVKADSKEIHARDVLSSDVVVMTPQMYVNMLITPLKKQRLYISDFTLMIFDECHHCAQQHPYNVVMEQVKETKVKPQIVGLTASVGTGKGSRANDMEAAIKHITELCARLSCITISSVRNPKNLEELKEKVSNPVDTFYQLRPANPDDFAHKIAMIMDDVQTYMGKYVDKMTQQVPELKKYNKNLPLESNTRCRNGSCKTTQIFSNSLLILKDLIDKKGTVNQPCRFVILKMIKLLQKLYTTLKTNELFPARLANDYLKNEMDEFFEHECRNTSVLSREKYEDFIEIVKNVRNNVIKLENDNLLRQSEEKPILKKLFDIIKEQHRECPTSRILIFVELRKAASELSKYVGSHNDVISTFGYDKVGFITSSNQTANRYGQSREEQSIALKRFDKGDLNILIATSVADEGLDVATCNLVIKYNTVGGEKSYIQRKGRARSLNSKSILLALDYDLGIKEYMNVLKAYMMNICVDRLQAMSDVELKKRIETAQKEIMDKDKQTKEILKARATQLEKNIFTLECSECATELCLSNQLRFIPPSQVVVCFADVWKDTTVVSKNSSKVRKEYGSSVSVNCGEWRCCCGKVRGEVIKYAEIYLPTLNIGAFKLRYTDHQRTPLDLSNRYKWKDIMEHYINIPQIVTNDIRDMAASLQDYEDIYKAAVNNELEAFAAIGNDKPHYKSRFKNETLME